MFFVIWSLKEAFVKAIGQGLGFDLHELYFTVQYENGPMAGKSHHINTESLKDCTPLEITSQSEFLYGTAKATWNGQLRHDWSFRFQSLDVSHLFTLALGPLECSIQSYSRAAWGLSSYSNTLSTKEKSTDALFAISQLPLRLP